MALTPELLEHYRGILTARREELATETLRAESEVAEQSDLDHLDPGDQAVAGTAKDELLEEAERDSGLAASIDEALRRIEAGTYGICTLCGEEIPVARLDAVPWASLCLKDQEKEDRRLRAAMLQGGAPSRVA
jgi:RNA polymerase-binding transcription factor